MGGRIRAIRGAICAHDNSRDAIQQAAQRLLREMVARNGLSTDEIVAAFFTMTPDLNAEFPAYAARDIGWHDVPMLGAQESPVPGALERVIRVLLLAAGQRPARHVYLGRAAAMRSDLTEPGDAESWNGETAYESTGQPPGTGTLLVVGLGLIGGSLAAAARRRGLFETVRGHDRDGDVLEIARRRGLVDDASDDLDSELAGADMVVLAAPVPAILDVLGRLAGRLRPGAVVTDVGGTKRAIMDAMDRLDPRVRAVGGHPMTGDTRSGPEAARADLFEGASWALVEARHADGAARQRVERLVRAVGAHPVWMGAEEHDRAVAATSHLPAAMAVALVEHVAESCAGARAAPALLGPGFVGASRLAAGDPELTAQMLATNASNLRTSIEALIESLREISELATQGPGALTRRLAEARETRMSLIGPR